MGLRRRSGSTLKGHYLPTLALQDALEVPIEEFAVRRRDFEPERIIASTCNLATNFPRRAGDESGQQLSFAIFDGPRDRHSTYSTLSS
jgi:hypothetical protein